MQITFDPNNRKDVEQVMAIITPAAHVYQETPEPVFSQTPPPPTDADEPQMEKDLAEKKAAAKAEKEAADLAAATEPVVETRVITMDDIAGLLRSYLTSLDEDKRNAARDTLRTVLNDACGVSATADLKDDQYQAAYDAFQKHIAGAL